MLKALERHDYALAKPLFDPLASFQPMCSAVLEGIHPGRVYVDDLIAPRTAFLTTFISSEEEGTWGFLAGEADNPGFNMELNAAIYRRAVLHPATPALMLTCHPQDWGGQLTLLFAPRQPIPSPRHHYLCQAMTYDWQAHLPPGFRIAPILRDAGEDSCELPYEVLQAVEKWRQQEDPRFQDFGFFAVDETRTPPQVAAWATIDFIAHGSGDAGLFTLDEYRRRGLATAVSAAAVEHGLAHGLQAVHWTCEENNLGSIRTAEKLGFQWERDYTMYYLMFDEAMHQGNLAYAHLQAGRYAQAAEVLEQGFHKRLELPLWAYFDAARCHAALDNPEKAFSYLRALAYRGWRNVEAVQNCRELKSLHGSTEWKTVLADFRQNQLRAKNG
jgi:RimJ/RimL family protein N-acetyltransferase